MLVAMSNDLTEATMVRNAGGRTMDAIRTIAVLQSIGQPSTIVVMHHTGMFCQL
jgi:carbonic anhydrase